MKNLLLGMSVFGYFAGNAIAAPSSPAPAVNTTSRDVLPPTFKPSSYNLHLNPDLTALTIAGDVRIEGEAPAPSRAIILNAKGLMLDTVRLDTETASSITYDAKLGRATLTFPKPFAAGHHTLSISYHGKIPKDQTVGLFAMDYATSFGPRRTLATNLEPAYARNVLPCWDEPGSKANFTLTIDAPADRVALSNMPQISSDALPDGRQRVRFAPSPKMSTYLFFAGIGDFERIHRTVDGIDVGVVVKRGDTAKAAFALDQAAALLHFYNSYFGIRFPLPKLDLIAAPGEINGGSMENWGAIFYSQEHLLLDPARATEEDRQLVFMVVAHEMAHQWFGDLVTMDWWENLWLNEGFARWMQTHAADALHPEWKTNLQAADIFENGKRADAQASTHPVVQPIRSAEQASQAFDRITYNKGAAVITMLEAYVGPDAFRAGVRRYIKAHAFGNTVDSDLWGEIQSVSGKPVLTIERDFTRQPGVPLIRAVPGTDGARLSEDRFAEDPASLEGQPKSSWHLPLAVRPPGGSTQQLLLPQDETASGDMPLLNDGALAFARMAYTPEHAAALASRMAQFPPMDQLNLMNDAWALGQSGYAPASNLAVFMAALPADADPLVWRRAVTLLTDIDLAMRDSPDRATFRTWALRLIAPIAFRLGTQPGLGEDPNAAILRANVWRAQAQFGDGVAIDRARHIFNTGKGSPSEQRAALDIVGQAADIATFEVLLLRVRATADPLERMHILLGMARTADPALARRMVDVATGPDAPAGSSGQLLATVGKTNPDVVWEELQPRLIQGTLPMDQETRWGLVVAIARFSARSERVTQVRAYGAREMPADARRPVESAVGSIHLNQAVQSKALPNIVRWIAAH